MNAKSKFVLINILGLFAALAFFFAASNVSCDLNLAGAQLSTNAGLVAFIAYFAGALLGAVSMLPMLGRNQEQNVAKLKEWQDQDAKLAVEVQSDKEKQLQAKIATLEAALKQALGK